MPSVLGSSFLGACFLFGTLSPSAAVAFPLPSLGYFYFCLRFGSALFRPWLLLFFPSLALLGPSLLPCFVLLAYVFGPFLLPCAILSFSSVASRLVLLSFASCTFLPSPRSPAADSLSFCRGCFFSRRPASTGASFASAGCALALAISFWCLGPAPRPALAVTAVACGSGLVELVFAFLLLPLHAASFALSRGVFCWRAPPVFFGWLRSSRPFSPFLC